MKVRLGIWTILITGSLLSAPTTPGGQVPLKNEPLERQTNQNLNMKRYVAAGDRAYVVGVQDGSQVPAVSLNPNGIGWHITGQMGGVWAHPIKLLNQFQFFLNGNLLPAATTFVSGEGYVRLELPTTNGLQISETEFAPDGLPVVLVGLQLSNSSPSAVSFTLAIQAESELIPAYPWSGTTPTSESLHLPDQVSFDSTLGALQFFQPAQPALSRLAWYALVSAALDPQDRQTGFQSLGASFPPNTSKHNGATGALSFQVNLKGKSSTTVWFAIAGSNVDKAEASAALTTGLASPDQLLSDKISSRQKVLSQAQIQVPDADIQAAFDWGKLNLADMQRTVRDMMVRDTMEGRVYPSPLTPSFPVLSGFGAGYPDYPWFFGTDGAYSTFSLSAVGQWQEAKNHLATIRQVSQLVNGSTGKVIHECVTDGSIYFGTNAQNGDVNETAEFATAAATLWRWSGDNSVRDDNYDFIIAGLKYITTQLVTSSVNPDGWPEGAGMVEATGMGALKLDVAVYTIRALNDLVEMADSKGDSATRDWAAMKASALINKFRQDWWIPSQGLFADSLALSQMVPTDPPAALGTQPGYTQLEQLYWINATPMETSFASVSDASMAFPQLESSTFTGTTGFFQQGQSLPAIRGNRQASAVNTGVMAIAEANYGRMDQSLRYVEFVADELDVEQPGALPELFPSPDYNYFSGGNPFGGAMVMQAWSSYGIHWPLEELYLGIKPDAPAKTLAVVPDLPGSWNELSIDNLNVGSDQIAVSVKRAGINYVTTVSAPAGWSLTIGYTFPVNTQIKSVRLNNSPAAFQAVNTNRGEEIHVQTNSGGTQEVRIQTK
jgi:glycogen debranching enzyme